jgi:integrase
MDASAVAPHRHRHRRRADKLAQAHGVRVRVSFAKVAEFQRRGLIHFHAIFRLDGLDPAHPAQCPQRRGGGLVFREIKERRRKTVPLLPELVSALREHRAAQSRERLAPVNVWEDHDLVWCQENGRPIDSRADWQEWAGILAEAGIPHAGVHAMRHSAATIALNQGVALAVLQELLSHSDIRVTREYTHVSSSLVRDGAERVGRALSGEK